MSRTIEYMHTHRPRGLSPKSVSVRGSRARGESHDGIPKSLSPFGTDSPEEVEPPAASVSCDVGPESTIEALPAILGDGGLHGADNLASESDDALALGRRCALGSVGDLEADLDEIERVHAERGERSGRQAGDRMVERGPEERRARGGRRRRQDGRTGGRRRAVRKERGEEDGEPGGTRPRALVGKRERRERARVEGGCVSRMSKSTGCRSRKTPSDGAPWTHGWPCCPPNVPRRSHQDGLRQ